MPVYIFRCLECEKVYEELTSWDKSGKYEGVKCPKCNSKSKEQQMHCCAPAIFTNPRGTSKAESFTYVAGYNMNQAQEERRQAEAKSHMGGTGEIYRHIDDVSSGKNEDFGKMLKDAL